MELGTRNPGQGTGDEPAVRRKGDDIAERHLDSEGNFDALAESGAGGTRRPAPRGTDHVRVSATFVAFLNRLSL